MLCEKEYFKFMIFDDVDDVIIVEWMGLSCSQVVLM